MIGGAGCSTMATTREAMKRADLTGVPVRVTSLTSTLPRDVATSTRRPAFVASTSYLNTPLPESTTISTRSPLMPRRYCHPVTQQARDDIHGGPGDERLSDDLRKRRVVWETIMTSMGPTRSRRVQSASGIPAPTTLRTRRATPALEARPVRRPANAATPPRRSGVARTPGSWDR